MNNMNRQSPTFANLEFQDFIFKEHIQNSRQSLHKKLRSLNKEIGSEFDRFIDSANIDISTLPNLALSKYAHQIQQLRISIPRTLKYIDQLCYISPKYFLKIQKIDVNFTGTMHDQKKNSYTLRITEDLFIRGLNIHANGKKIRSIKIEGEVNIEIDNSNFYGVELSMQNNHVVKILNSNFSNSSGNGFSCYKCISIFIKNVQILNSRFNGCLVQKCQKCDVKNVEVFDSGTAALDLSCVKNFQIESALAKNCQYGFYFEDATGKIKNSNFLKCTKFGVKMFTSVCYYNKFQYAGNLEDDVEMDSWSIFVQEDGMQQ